MESTALSNAWMPDCPWRADAGVILDETFCDFDAQAERLTGHDQDYIQLSPGPFNGRFVSCFLGARVSLHIEHANQVLQQAVLGSPDVYSVGVVLTPESEFRVHGCAIGPDSLFVLPPGGVLHLRSPANASILALVVDRSLLLEKFSDAPYIIDWLDTLDPRPAICHAPVLAERLRQDAFSALTSCANWAGDDVDQTVLGDILVSSFAASVMLAWAGGMQFSGTATPRSFKTFLAIHENTKSNGVPVGIDSVSHLLNLSHRSIQYACAREGTMGFGAYQRLLRLHAARRCLHREAQDHRSIGDIASDFGFMNWSHFGDQYRSAFGERPSQTRANRPRAAS